jgi:hypothetical protein
VTVANAGPSDAQAVAWTDSLPAGETFVSQLQTVGPVFTLSNVGNNINDTIATLPAGSSATFTVTVQVGALSNGTILTNTANITSTTSDPNANNNTSSASTTVNTSAGADLSVTKTAPATVAPGGQIIYTLNSRQQRAKRCHERHVDGYRPGQHDLCFGGAKHRASLHLRQAAGGRYPDYLMYPGVLCQRRYG